MPYKDPETRREKDRERQRKHRQANPAKPPHNGDYWKGSEQNSSITGQLTDIDSNFGKPRYNLLAPEGEHVSLEQTSELRRLLAVNRVVDGDLIRVEFVGWRQPKKPDPRRHAYKTYRLTVVERRSSVLSGLLKPTSDDLDHALDGLGGDAG